VATAGGPGASKSTILETYLHNNPGFVYIEPVPFPLFLKTFKKTSINQHSRQVIF